MAKPGTARRVFDPLLNGLVAERDTSSDRIRAKLTDAYDWCLCELCWRSTEYATAVGARKFFKRPRRENAHAAPLTDAIRVEAQKEADALVARYERAWKGEFGPYEPGRMVATYCDIVEMRGDCSVEAFREHIEQRALIAAWARHSNLLAVTRLPGQPKGAAKPSKLYCEAHNPRRSDEARRAYQRDKRFAPQYNELIEKIWTEQAGNLLAWDIETHVHVKKEAYRQLQALKSPTRLIDDLLAQGTMSQAEIARQLGVSRQAVSAAIKRRSQKPVAVGLTIKI